MLAVPVFTHTQHYCQNSTTTRFNAKTAQVSGGDFTLLTLAGLKLNMMPANDK